VQSKETDVAKRTTKKRVAAKRVPAKRAAAKRVATRVVKKKRAVKTTARRKVAARAAATRKAGRGSRGTRGVSTPKRPAPKKPSALASAAAAVKGALAGAVAIVARRLPGDTDAIALLERDHRRLEDLLKRGEDTTERAVKGRAELLRTITSELNLHELVEEKILYPALQVHPEARAIVLEGFQEHHVADLVLKELHEVARDHEQWGAKFKVLKENLEHHIQEEEGPMFRTARGLLSREALQEMGAQMRKMKAQAI
jgi:hemerythrin-like domain-containing protein